MEVSRQVSVQSYECNMPEPGSAPLQSGKTKNMKIKTLYPIAVHLPCGTEGTECVPVFIAGADTENCTFTKASPIAY